MPPERVDTVIKRNKWRDRYVLACVAGLGLALTVAVSVGWRSHDLGRLKERFAAKAEQVEQAITEGVRVRCSMMQTLRAFYNASSEVSRSEFTLATAGFLRQYRDTQAFAWIPRIRHEQRAAFETSMRRDGMESFQFTQPAKDGSLVRCPRKHEYYPLSYVEPYTGNETYIGYDMAAFAPLANSRDTGDAILTYPPDLETTKRRFCIVVPVYDQNGVDFTVVGRRAALQGFVLGVFQINRFVENTAGDIASDSMYVQLSDLTADEARRVLYASANKPASADEQLDRANTGEGFVRAAVIDVNGCWWRLDCSATEIFLAEARGWSSWIVLAVGSCLTVLVTLLVRDHVIRTRRIEEQVAQRTAELDKVHRELLQVSRKAGMSEIATGILHNVGNVLNSVNVATNQVVQKVRKSRVAELGAASDLIAEHIGDMAGFVTEHPQGKHMARYMIEMGKHLANEQKDTLDKLDVLRNHIDHIKEVVAMQQSYARVSAMLEDVSLPELLEDALRMRVTSFGRHHIDVVREYEDVPPIRAERHRVMQIIVNLVGNAKHAISDHRSTGGKVTLRLSWPASDRVRLEVADDGVGISSENLSRIFSYGFTTKKNGHGFGLHSSALAAKEMGGTLTVQSAGEGRGATFILELPLLQKVASEKAE